MSATLEYRTIETLSWEKILRSNARAWPAPLTVHLPIQAEHSPDWIFVDAAFNVTRYRVLPGLSSRDPEHRKQARQTEIMQAQFAFDDPPFVPDFHCGAMRLEANRYPLASVSYYAWDLDYRIEYCCQPLKGRQQVLWIRGTVCNAAREPREATVRARVCFLPEAELCEYHYVPFTWDAVRYRPSPRTGLDGTFLTRDGRAVGRIWPGAFESRWESERVFSDEDYNRRFCCETPYHVAPALRYREVRQAVCFHAGLEPGESRSFALALLTDYEQAGPDAREVLTALDEETGRQAALAHFRKQESVAAARLECAANGWQDLFVRMQTMIRQMLVRFPGHQDLAPMQGGSSERHYVWVWEAVIMLQPLLRLGHFELVRKALDFIFSLQDSGHPPVGQLTTTKGAVGTTGPRWLCTTGAALALASDYALLTGDSVFLQEYLPKMLRAADWILGEIKATRCLTPEGARPPWFGLMPFGCATDGDIGYIVAKTDGYSFWGLAKFSALLEARAHPRAGEIKKESANYKADLLTAIAGMTRPDGYIERKILTGTEKKITPKFERVSGAQQLFYTGVLEVTDPRLPAFMRLWEEQLAEGPFLGVMDREVAYIGNSECYWQDIYLRRGEWKKAFLALQTFLLYGLTADTHVVQERISRRNPAYTPWQPNGSGSGRVLEMLLKALFFQRQDDVVLLAGMPFAWLRDNGRTVLEGLFTPHGRLTLAATMQPDDLCRLVLEAEQPAALPRRIVIPGFFTVRATRQGMKAEDGGFRPAAGSRKAEFLLADAERH